jgi:cyclopropane-fatty-acyl-phospholipid synthase
MARMQVAPALAQVVDAPVGWSAYDGSSAGPADAPVAVEVRSRKALAHVVSAPGELGLARAYVSGEIGLTTPGTPAQQAPAHHYTALQHLASAGIGVLSWRQRAEVLRSLGPEALTWVEPPPQEVGARRYVAGVRAHLPGRDALAIAHHYDVSNKFYDWVLGPSMAYTCAVYPHAEASLEQAQENKFDLVCRKLGLQPGMRLLDVGCGWGGMVRHAVEHYGVTALGVTLSRQQAEYGQKMIAELGLSDRAEIRHDDYRNVTETGFDAVSSIGLTEHIGIKHLPAYAERLASRLKPQGRLLNHCITRADDDSRPIKRRGFIARYVFPDGELPGVGRVITVLQRAGLEVRHEENLREHYARTLAAWCDNLDARWTDAVREVGEATAKVWALYMAGSRLEFERNRIQLHQVLAVKPEHDAAGQAQIGMPLRPDWGV